MKKTLVIFTLLCTITSSAYARPHDSSLGVTTNQCANLIKECFAYSGDEKLTCFSTVGNHPFCESTELGNLALKRYSYGPSTKGLDQAPSLLGPQLMDQKCIANFDNQWSGMLLKESITGDSIRSLSKTLDGCKKSISNEILRP